MKIEELSLKETINYANIVCLMINEKILKIQKDGTLTFDYTRTLRFLEKQNVTLNQKISRQNHIIDTIEAHLIQRFNKTQDVKYLDDIEFIKKIVDENKI